MNYLQMTLPESGPIVQSPSCSCGILKNIGRRHEQQDSVAVSDWRNAALCQERGILMTLADGMGGMSNGAEISSLLIDSMQTAFSSRPTGSSPSQRLLELLGEANRRVNDFTKDKDPSGSTLVAALILENQLYYLSVGDSRIYLARGGGLIPLTREHSYGQKLDLMLLKDILPASVLSSHPQRRALTSYVGMGDLESVDRNSVPVTLLPGDALLLLSDGVFGTLSEAEILSCLGSTAEISAIRMERKVLEKNLSHQDNFSAVIFQL